MGRLGQWGKGDVVSKWKYMNLNASGQGESKRND